MNDCGAGLFQGTEGFPSARGAELTAPLALRCPCLLFKRRIQRDKMLTVFSALFRWVMLQAGTYWGVQEHSCSIHSSTHLALKVTKGKCQGSEALIGCDNPEQPHQPWEPTWTTLLCHLAGPAASPGCKHILKIIEMRRQRWSKAVGWPCQTPLGRGHPRHHLSAPGALQRAELLLLYSLILGRQHLLGHPWPRSASLTWVLWTT